MTAILSILSLNIGGVTSLSVVAETNGVATHRILPPLAMRNSPYPRETSHVYITRDELPMGTGARLAFDDVLIVMESSSDELASKAAAAAQAVLTLEGTVQQLLQAGVGQAPPPSRLVADLHGAPLITGCGVVFGTARAGKTTILKQAATANPSTMRYVAWGEPDADEARLPALHRTLHEVMHVARGSIDVLMVDSMRKLAFTSTGGTTAEGGVDVGFFHLLTDLSIVGRSLDLAIIGVVNPLTAKEEKVLDFFERVSGATSAAYLLKLDGLGGREMEYDVRLPTGRANQIISLNDSNV